MKDKNAILIDFMEHEWFDMFYKEILDKAIKKQIGIILDPRLEEDQNKYTRSQIERKVLKIMEALRQEPTKQMTFLTANSSNELSEYGKHKLKQEWKQIESIKTE